MGVAMGVEQVDAIQKPVMRPKNPAGPPVLRARNCTTLGPATVLQDLTGPDRVLKLPMGPGKGAPTLAPFTRMSIIELSVDQRMSMQPTFASPSH